MNVPTDPTTAPGTVANLSRRDALSAFAGTLGAAAAFGFVRPAAAQEGAGEKKQVVQTAKFKIGAGREEEALTMLRGLTKKVEELEPGVLVYLCHRVATDPTAVFFFEVYADEAALANHGQQPHLGELRAGFQSGLFAPPVEIVKLEQIGGFAR